MANINLTNMFLNMQCSGASSSINASTSNASVKGDLQNLGTGSFGAELNKAQNTQRSTSTRKTTSSNNVQETSSTQKKNADSSAKDKIDETATNNKTSKTNEKSTKKADDTKKVNQTQKSEDVKEVATVTEETEKASVEVNDAIMSLLEQNLQISQEKLQTVMEDMGIEPIDLLNQDTFTDFVAALYPEQDSNAMLLEENPLKDIGKVFTQIEDLCTQFKEERGIDFNQLLADKQLKNDVVSEALQQRVENELPNVVNEAIENAVEPVQLNENVQIVQAEATTFKEAAVSPTAVNAAAETMAIANDVPDIGIVVPINEVNSIQDMSLKLQGKAQTVASPHQTMQLTNQIIDKIDFKALGDMKEVNMQLNPKELGNLSIKLVETNGSIVAEIKVDTEKTKNFLVNEIDSLKDALTEQGLNVSDVKVDIKQNESEAQMERQKQKSSKRIQEIIDKAMNDLEEEDTTVPLAVESDTEVDYMV